MAWGDIPVIHPSERTNVAETSRGGFHIGGAGPGGFSLNHILPIFPHTGAETVGHRLVTGQNAASSLAFHFGK